MINVIYAGYRKWSYSILKKLLKINYNKWQIKAVITISHPEVKFHRLSIPCFVCDPKKLSDKKILREVKKFSPQIFLFYGWSWLIPKEIYTKYRCLILHPSPLPKYRGGSPLQNQIMEGETKSAVTIFQVGEDIDSGDIYSQKTFSLSGSLKQIFKRIITVGSTLTIKVLNELANGTSHPTKQNDKQATYFRRRKPEDSQLTINDFKNKTSQELYNFIRALANPYPNAFFVCKDGKKIFFMDVKLEDEK